MKMNMITSGKPKDVNEPIARRWRRRIPVANHVMDEEREPTDDENAMLSMGTLRNWDSLMDLGGAAGGDAKEEEDEVRKQSGGSCNSTKIPAKYQPG